MTEPAAEASGSPEPAPQRKPTPDELAGMFEALDRELLFVRILQRPVVTTWWLIVAISVIWVGAKIYGVMVLVDGIGLSTHAMEAEQLFFATGVKQSDRVWQGEWWRLCSSVFVHLNFMHLAFNVWGLYVLGPLLERFYGGRRFLLLFLVSGIVGSLASAAFLDAPSGGASGAIYGLVGALVVFGVKYRKDLPDRVSRAFTVNMVPWVAFSIGIGFLDALPFDNAAHVGGLLSGAAMAVVLGSRLRRRTAVWGNRGLWALTVAAVGVLVWTNYMWSHEIETCLVSHESYLMCYPDMALLVETPPRVAPK